MGQSENIYIAPKTTQIVQRQSEINYNTLVEKDNVYNEQFLKNNMNSPSILDVIWKSVPFFWSIEGAWQVMLRFKSINV